MNRSSDAGRKMSGLDRLLAPRPLATLVVALALGTALAVELADDTPRDAARLAETFWKEILQVDENAFQTRMAPGLREKMEGYGDLLCRKKNGVCGLPRVAEELKAAVMASSGGVGAVACEFEGRESRLRRFVGKSGAPVEYVGTCGIRPPAHEGKAPSNEGAGLMEATMTLVASERDGRVTWLFKGFTLRMPGEEFVFSEEQVLQKSLPIQVTFAHRELEPPPAERK